LALASGIRLGPYEVIAQIGAGGMGEVYRARDTKLSRDVALKILPDGFALDGDRIARFRREAQVLAALNQPNIAHIYGFEDSGDIHALVLELVEGPTLADRIAKGSIPLDEALPIAKQIADALEAAHEQGIIHRDLKPANIKVRDDGTVKVLDFGLAKALEPASSLRLDVANSPTITTPAMTGIGVILGTAAYMAPEQAKARPADKRSDIWAFGCVLFEMLTGRRAFGNEDVSDTLAAVLKTDPEWAALPDGTPGPVRHVLHRCLTKDPRQRLHDIADARVELETLGREQVDEIDSRAPVLRRPWRFSAWLTVAGIAGGALVGVSIDRGLHALRDQPVTAVRAQWMRTTVDVPVEAPLALGSDLPGFGYNSPLVAVSPDGAWLAYVAKTAMGRLLYLREMSSGDTRPLPGTEGAIHAFFSPDSQWIGFLTVDHVKKIPRHGGTAISLSEADTPVLGWWTRPDVIYFTENETFVLSRVSADGGMPQKILASTDVNVTRFNDVLPDGQTVLAESSAGIGGDYGDILLLNVSTRRTKVLIRSGFAARYVAPGYVLFARAGNLMAVRFDVNRGEVVGEPVAVASGVAMESLFGILHATSSATGIAAYLPGADLSVGKLARIDRRGAVEYLETPERVYGSVALAPDGTRLAVHVADVNDYIWIWDMQRREGRRVASSTAEGYPHWSPDGRQIAGSTASRAGIPHVFVHDVGSNGGVGEGRTLEHVAGRLRSWSPQGDVLALTLSQPAEVRFVSRDRGQPVNAPGFKATFADFSPDGRWLAVQSSQTGTGEIFIRSYPEGKIVGQLSTGGGVEPLWKPPNEVFYRNGHRWFSTHVSTSPTPRWDPPRLVFDTEFMDTPGISYDVSPDGQRLFVVKRAQPLRQSRIEIVSNWFEILR